MRALTRFLGETYGGLPATTWLVCLAAFVNRAGSMVLPFLQIYLGVRFGYSVADAGLVLSLYGIGSILGNLLGGRLADRIGPVRVQILAMFGAGLWLWCLALAAAPWQIGCGMLLFGVLADMFRPGNMASVVGSCAPLLRAKALALNRLAINAGWAIGPAVGGQLASVDYRLLFLADGLTCALAGLVLLLFVPRESGPAAGAPAATVQARGPSPWQDRRFLGLLGLSVALLLVFMQYFTTETRYLKEAFGLREGTIGLLLSINPILIVLLEMPLVHALRGRAQLPIVAFGALLIGLAFPLLVPVAWGTAGVVASLLVLTAGEMFYSPFLGAFVGDQAPAAMRGRYLGLYGASFAFAFVLAPSLGGRVYDRLGAGVLWYAGGAVGALTAAGFLWLHRSHALRPTGRAADDATPPLPAP